MRTANLQDFDADTVCRYLDLAIVYFVDGHIGRKVGEYTMVQLAEIYVFADYLLSNFAEALRMQLEANILRYENPDSGIGWEQACDWARHLVRCFVILGDLSEGQRHEMEMIILHKYMSGIPSELVQQNLTQ